MSTLPEGNATVKFDEELMQLYGPPPASRPTPACPEAALSLCLKGRLRGIEAQLTVRGANREEFLTNVLAVMDLTKHLDDLTVLFDERPGTPPAATTPPASPPEGWCATHGVQMKQTTKEGHSWWSHKTSAGWCKGR